MKRNMERSSGSSDEDKKALKKAKKENSGKLKNAEIETGEIVSGSNRGRNAQVSDCERNDKNDVDGSSDNICGIGFTQELHSGGGISYNTFASNCDTNNTEPYTIVSCLNSLYNLELENNINSSIRVGFPNYQRHKVREKESSKNHDGIGHEIVPSRHSWLDETSNHGTFDNGAYVEGSRTRKRLFCCVQSAFNYLTEDIDHCVKRPCSCLGVPHRSDQNNQSGYNGADRRKISRIIHFPWLYSRNERIGSFHRNQNSLFIERSELNYHTNSTYNFASNIDESGREHTKIQSGQENYEYDSKFLDGRVQEINQYSSEHSLLDETSIVDAYIDYVETVDADPSFGRRLFCCPQNALSYLLEDINEWRRALCSCQDVQFRNGGGNWCSDRGRSIDTPENHSKEHDSYQELPSIISGTRGCETAVRYPEVEIIGTVVKISDCKVETIPVCDSRKIDNKAREFHFVGVSTSSDKTHRARNYNDDAHEVREYDNVEEEYLLDEGREESGDDYNNGNYEAGDYNNVNEYLPDEDEYSSEIEDGGYISAEDVDFRSDQS